MAVLARRRDLDGETVLVTAGPTVEDIDPVRFVSNRSSGKMGYRLAEAARDRGRARGPRLRADGARRAVRHGDRSPCARRRRWPGRWSERGRDAAIVAMAAAVSDYRPAERRVAEDEEARGGRQP